MRDPFAILFGRYLPQADPFAVLDTIELHDPDSLPFSPPTGFQRFLFDQLDLEPLTITSPNPSIVPDPPGWNAHRSFDRDVLAALMQIPPRS